MKTSDKGRALIEQREGVRLQAYRDSVGIWTIGVGHTSAAGEPHVTPGLTITQAKCDEILSRDLAKFEAAVSATVKVSVTPNQFDALVSLAFNIGEHGFTGSTVVHRLNAGDVHGAADAFLMWEKPPELKGRREGERHQFLTAY